jgi:hypothetical protein
MPAPVIRQFVGTIPDKGQAQTEFDTNVDAFLDWMALQFAPDLVAFGTFASATGAALVTANLPPLTGRAANMVRVNAAADGVEFRTPAQVLSDISAASVASVALKAPLDSPALTGFPTAPNQAAGSNSTRLATTSYTRAAIPNVLNATGSAPIYAARAWVNFNGTSTVAIRASGNVSSITDNGMGDYTVNFATAMPDANYSFVSGQTIALDGTKGAVALSGGYNSPATAKTTTSLRIRTKGESGLNFSDFEEVNVAIFR